MKTMTEISGAGYFLTVVIASRDDLEKAIEWLPLMRPAFPHPAPIPDPPPVDNAHVADGCEQFVAESETSEGYDANGSPVRETNYLTRPCNRCGKPLVCDTPAMIQATVAYCDVACAD